MARVQAVLDLVQTRLTAQYGAVTYRTGHKFLGEKVGGPRIVWVPGKDSFGAATDGRQQRPRAVRTRQAEVFVHCFEESFGAAEELVNAVVYCLHAEATVSFRIDEGDWSQPTWLEHGSLCTLHIVLDIPVTAPSPVVVTVPIALDNSTTVQGDGYLDAGEST